MRYSYHIVQRSAPQQSQAEPSRAKQRLQSSVLVVLRVISAVFVPQSIAERSLAQFSRAERSKAKPHKGITLTITEK